MYDQKYFTNQNAYTSFIINKPNMNLSKTYNLISDLPKFRQKQIDHAIFVDLISDWDEVTTLPKDLRQNLKEEASLAIKAQAFKISGETTKVLIELEDGNKIEAVLMLHNDGRRTVCVSSQVGCPLGCKFCATGQMGFARNLTAEEIIEQVIFFARHLKKNSEKITNIVYMGMGEPFLNYDNVIQSIKILNDPNKFNFGIRNFSISTVGITEGIDKLAESGLQVNLAISLHATNNELRSKLMPINDKYPLEKIFDSVKNYITKTSRRVMLEYLLIRGVNDSITDAEKLAKILNHRLLMANLIPLNPVNEFQSPDKQTIKRFQEILDKRHAPYTMRHAFGQEINAACGQLANR